MRRLGRMIAEMESELSRQSETARAQLLESAKLDRSWGDTVASQVAVINARRAATLALDLAVIRKAASTLDDEA
jgi:hypothetical protein